MEETDKGSTQDSFFSTSPNPEEPTPPIEAPIDDASTQPIREMETIIDKRVVLGRT
jgi:hypothetical protein